MRTNVKRVKVLLIFLTAVIWQGVISGQENVVQFNGGVDVVSRYVWRGLDFGKSPSFQPYVEADLKGYKLGVWGAYKTAGAGWQETDIYLSKSFKYVTFAIFDYYSYLDTLKGTFFNYKKGETAHMLEGQILLSGEDKVPLKLLLSWFFYGAAPDNSFYIEGSYTKSLSNGSLDVFVGFTPHSGYYADKAALVNVGCRYNRNIAITDKFSLPLKLSLILNPNEEHFYLVAGFSL